MLGSGEIRIAIRLGGVGGALGLGLAAPLSLLTADPPGVVNLARDPFFLTVSSLCSALAGFVGGLGVGFVVGAWAQVARCNKAADQQIKRFRR
jgi:hypothetical protein